MKKGLHPEYFDCTVRCSCGNTFQTRATKPELKIELCNVCHPFYTGQQKFVDTGGRVQRFTDKFGSAADSVAAREAARRAEKLAAAEAAEAAGADALSCINTLSGMAVDLESRGPLLANITGGLSGPAVKPVALRCVWQVCRAVHIPVIGIGGISSARDALEFILVGARAVEVGTAGFTDPTTIFRIVEELAKLCERLGVSDLDSFRGSLRV